MLHLYFIRTCSCRKYALSVVFIFITALVSAQIKWDGEAGDGQWATAVNWSGDILPGTSDDILLDNSFVNGNYTITLPGGVSVVSIRTIVITPLAGNSIRLVLPVSNTAVSPAFTATGPGYGILLNNGAVFQNSSGAGSGVAVFVTDSFRINNGGQYIHNSRTAHAALVTILSKSPGTETGIFKFDVPGGSYTFSAANRTYGVLMFNSDASAGTQSYNAIAANPLTINGDLVINPGVTVNLDINNNVFINRNYIQDGSTFNIASQPNNNTTFIKGDIIQNSGVITESSTGLPAIELNGGANQNIMLAGSIANSVNFRINNPSGVTLLGNVALPYHLDLVNGIVNSNSYLLTLLTGCTIHADSATGNSFINGMLRKEGLSGTSHFLFPVGKGITQRWLELKNVTGNYTVEFFKSNPRLISNTMAAGVDHISSIEYWTVEPDAVPAPIATIELSFDNVNSGGVTDLATLLVAKLFNTSWADAGNAGTTGVVGIGSVLSKPVDFSLAGTTKYFTLASSNALQNPLPVRTVSFTAIRNNFGVQLNWQTENDYQPVHFEPQVSKDGLHFSVLTIIRAGLNQANYQYTDKSRLADLQFYRLKVIEKDGLFFYTQAIPVILNERGVLPVKLMPSIISNKATLLLNSVEMANLQIKIYDMRGISLQTKFIKIVPGPNSITLQVQSLPAGMYLLSVTDQGKSIANIRFVKLN